MKKPILVVTPRLVKPIEARIEKEYEVRRKTDGTLFTQMNSLRRVKVPTRYSSRHSTDSTPIFSGRSRPPSK